MNEKEKQQCRGADAVTVLCLIIIKKNKKIKKRTKHIRANVNNVINKS